MPRHRLRTEPLKKEGHGRMASAVCFRVAGPKIVHEAFEDEVVIVNLETGTYYSVEGVAAEIWTRINTATVTEIIDGLAGRYGAGPGEVAPVVTRFIDELQGEGLIAAAELPPDGAAAGRATDPPAAAEPGPFQAPVLRRFDDMQELLLLDPIHDFDEAGWPIAKPAEPNEE